MLDIYKETLLTGIGLLALIIVGAVVSVLFSANAASAQSDPPPRLIVSTNRLDIAEGGFDFYSVHFDRNPAGFDGIECGEEFWLVVGGVDASYLDVASPQRFHTGNENCSGGNWSSDPRRTIYVDPLEDDDEDERPLVTLTHEIWNADYETVVEASDLPTLTVKIYENDVSGASVSIVRTSHASEGRNATFELTRENDDMTQARTVSVRLSETGSMLSGSRSRTVEFAANAGTATLEVATVDDEVDEDNSVVTATITAPSGYTIKGLPWATATVIDNDIVLFSLSAQPGSIEEGERSTLTVSSTNDVTFAEDRVVELDLMGSTATPGDYTISPAVLTFRAERTETTATITAVNDNYNEGEEEITVRATVDARTVGPTTITIAASDPDGPISTWSATLTVGEGMPDGETFLGFSRLGGSNVGTLAPPDFSHETVQYTVMGLTLEDPSNPSLLFYLGSILTTGFALELDGRRFLPKDATGTLSSYEWSDPRLNWSDGQMVDVKLDAFDPMLSRIRMENVMPTTADAIVEVVNGNGRTVHMQYRQEGATMWLQPNPAMQTVMPGTTSVQFSLTPLTDGDGYEVEASLDGGFPAEGTIPTTFTAGSGGNGGNGGNGGTGGTGGGGGGSAPANGVPEFQDAEGYAIAETARAIAEDAAVGANIGEPVAATDPDDDPLTYSLSGGDAASFAIDPSTGQLTTATALDHETKASYSVTVTATDPSGAAAEVEVAITVTEVVVFDCTSGNAVSDAAGNPGLVADCEALLRSRDRLAGDATLNWSEDTAITEWDGVRLGETPQRVTQLYLVQKSLGGTIPADLGSLSRLTGLYLHRNELTGPIPSQLGELSSLVHLTLHRNRLSGEVPAALGDLTELTFLSLYRNNLTGELPAELGGLSSLRWLYLHSNKSADGGGLSGPIPAALGDLPNLERLLLYGNGFSGAIPAELGRLPNLKSLLLHDNEFTGQIPGELGDLSGLRYLWLDDNDLSGAIPPQLGNLSELRWLSLYGNALSGAIPGELGDLSGLRLLILDRNDLSGTIPARLGELSELTWLDLNDNDLSGAIPSELGDLSNLEHLYLHSNALTGAVPAELGQLSSLTNLWLRDNRLSGRIPPSLGELPNLQRVRIAGNAFTGCVPDGLLGEASWYSDAGELELPACVP